jgi:hypothetical protein
MHRARFMLPSLLFVFLIALGALPGTADAQCPGDCGPDLATVPKTVEKFVKARWKAALKCGKRGEPVCPTACPLPDAAADPYLLSPSCAGLIACELDALAETAYDTTWDDTGVCASAPATACGNARAANAGKLVSTKLTRRRASKMNAFAKDVAKCSAKIAKVPSCSGDICNDAADWIDGFFPLPISAKGFQILPFSVLTDGQGVAELTIATVGTDWGTLGAESVVVSYDLDGEPRGQLVLYGGETPTTYRVLLGHLLAGEHTIGLHPEKKLSPAAKAPVSVTAAVAVEALTSPDPRFQPTMFAPIILGIDEDLNQVPVAIGTHLGNAVSDVPLIIYAKTIPHVGFSTIRYTLIWSNEDGGTGLIPDLLIARFGRTTDIEGILEVDVSDTGFYIGARFRPDESGTLTTFAGEIRYGSHPVIRTATANGLVQDDGASTLNFGLVPYLFDDTGLPRELGMDLDPLSYVIMGKEMVREGKIEITPNPASKKLSDLSNYLYLDFDIDVSVGGEVLRGVAVVNGVSYFSDHALPFTPAVNPRVTDGVKRIAVEIPAGTTIDDVEQFGVQGIGTMSGTLASTSAFVLDTDYVPSAPLTFAGPLFQSGTNPSWLVTP